MKVFAAILFLLITASSFGQVDMHCETDHRFKRNLEIFPHLEQQYLDVQRAIDRSSAGQLSRDMGIHTIQVVVHVLWFKPEERLSNAQILHQLDILNLDFNQIFRDEIQPQFRSSAAEVGIQFCLAPDGIIRKQVPIEEFGGVITEDNQRALHYDSEGGSSPRDPERFMNIWIVDLPGGILGSASFPGAAPFPNEDGILIDPEYVGSTGTATGSNPFNLGRTLTHEVGHYLNLFHPWGLLIEECEEDDGIEDTPQQSRIIRGCPSVSKTCGSDDQVNNYMQFTDDLCLRMFTEGQKQEMISVLTSVRSGLLDEPCDLPTQSGDLTEDLIIRYIPTDQFLYIENVTEGKNEYDLSIYDLSGRLVSSAAVSQDRILPISMIDIPTGIYLIRVESETDTRTDKIFIF